MPYKLPLKPLAAGALVVAAAVGISLLPSSGASAQRTSSKAATPAATPPSAQLELSVEDQALLLSLLDPRFPATPAQMTALLKERWTAAYIAPSLEIFNFIPDPRLRSALVEQLEHSTGQSFGSDINAWYRWLWNEPEVKAPGYDNFKSEFYSAIDPKFARYFKDRGESAQIRLDEIRWGGVVQDGIPPLRQPKMISAAKADYLDDGDIVFGIEVNGDVRAYPKRILAWHEMFVDTVGGVKVAGVYCTLCGFFVLYDTEASGLSHDIGTSGFLYRSNKLMYDNATQSLWNTIKGEPVLGPLVGKDIALQHRSVVTTTWGEWKRRHPKSQVLSLKTGHRRDYGEGVAYHQYFSTDRLMFNTPYTDQRLNNKDEVLALRFRNSPHDQLAISADYLKKNPIVTDKVGNQNILVLTDKTGGNRVYDPKGIVFTGFDGDRRVTDESGGVWTLSESKLLNNDGREVKRLPYNRAFWFGWHATYPDSRLIK